MTFPSLSTKRGAAAVDAAAVLEQIYRPIASDLEGVQHQLLAELDRELPWLDELIKHSGLSGGKRIRPALTLLAGKSVGAVGERHIAFATALEMIHTASLIHDDVLDRADTRRHRSTIYHRRGNRTSVLFGDYLFTHAFFIATRTESLPVLRRLSLASNRVCEGELKQNAWAGNFELGEGPYLEMIKEKTAELCACGCFGGAWLAGAPSHLCAQFERFGQDLGIAFQIIDDVLDLVGDSKQVGKTLGTDLVGRKATLPIIHALEQRTDRERAELLAMLESGEADSRSVVARLEATGSIQYARNLAQSYAQSAREFAASLPASPATDSLKAIAEFTLARTF